MLLVEYQAVETAALKRAERAIAHVTWADTVELHPIMQWQWIVAEEEGEMFLLFVNGVESGLVYRGSKVWEWVSLFNGEEV